MSLWEKASNFLPRDPSYGQRSQLMQEAAENRATRAAGRAAGLNGGYGVAEVDNFKGGAKNWGANHLEGAKIDLTKNYAPAAKDVLSLGGSAAGNGLKARAGAFLGAAGKVAAPLQVGYAGLRTAHDVANTSTEDYQKRFGQDPNKSWVSEGGATDKLLNAVGIGENGRQFGKDLLTRIGGAATDTIASVADATPFAPDVRKYFADKQATPAPAAAPEDGLRQTQAAPLPQLQVGAPFKTDGISPEMQARMQEKGIKFEGAATPPGETPEYGNSTEPLKKGNLSVIQTGGAENYARQLANIQGLREGMGPAGGQVSFIANPDVKKNDVATKAMEAIDSLPRNMSPGNKADAVAHLLSVATGAQRANAEAARPARDATRESTGPSFRDLLEAKKFQYQVGRDGLQDSLAVENNTRQNRVAGANLAATALNIEKGREDLTAKQFGALFRKKDEKNADVADTESISRFSGELAKAIETLANSGDKADVARFGIQYKKADGSLGLRARAWDELTDTDKNELVRGFKFSDHVKKYATDGDKGGNFAEYMRGRKDAQGRIVFGAGGKTRAIADEALLNSDGDTWNPLNLLNPYDKRSFGLNEKRDRTEGFVK